MGLAFDAPGIRSHAITRARLLQKLGSGDDRPLLAVVHGHAGSGKSTLLAQWAESQPWTDEALLWITMREDDAGTVPFWNRIGESIIRNELGGREILPLLQRQGVDGAVARGGAFRMLTRNRPLTLLIDDYHLVADASLDEALGALAIDVPGLRLVIGSRVLNGLGSITLAARVRTTMIGGDELAFTRGESDELLAQHGLGDDEALRETMFEASVGWPLASQALIIESQRDHGRLQDASAAALGSRSLFVDEFVVTTLASRSAREADFLLRISVADECTIELAALLSGDTPDVAGRRLAELEADGIGTWQLRSGIRWFRIHPLLRDAFEARAVDVLEPAVVARLRGTLSDRLRTDRPLRALELAYQIADWDRFETISLLEYGPLTYYYRIPNGRLVASLPPEAYATRAALAGVYLATLYGIPTTSVEELKRLAQTLGLATRQYAQAPGLLGAFQLTAISSSHRLVGDDRVALAFAERAVAAIDAAPRAERALASASLPTLYAQVATTFLLEGEYTRALDLLEKAWEVTSELGLTGERFQAAALTALTHAVRGDIVSAAHWIEICDSAGTYDGWFVGYLDSGYYMAQAIIALNHWDGPGAREALTTPGTREHLIEFWPYLAVIDARARLWENGPLDALSELAATIARKRQRPTPPATLLALLATVRAEMLILAGQPARADAVLQDSDPNHPGIRLATARTAALRGDLSKALTLADRVSWDTEEHPRLRVESLLTIASLAVDTDEKDRAVENFTAAIAAVRRYGIRLPLLSLPQERLTELVALSIQAGRDIPSDLFATIPEVTRRVRRVSPLSRAELRVLRALRSGDIDKAAVDLHLSAHTVRYHLKRTYPKLGVNSRQDAVRAAQELGLLDEQRELLA